MDQNNLIDIGFDDHPWTWSNHWDNEGEVRQILDICLGSFEWFQTFEKARCQHMDTYTSDHSMLLLDIDPGKEKKKKRFYFDKRWLQREGVKQVVERAWQKEEPSSRMFKITKKVKNYRVELLKWRNTFQAISKEGL